MIAAFGGSSAVPNATLPGYENSYHYSTEGNLEYIDRNDDGGQTSTIGLGYLGHRAVSLNGVANAFGYDASGNMTTRQHAGKVFHQSFDAQHRLVQVSAEGVETHYFDYDAEGQRTKVRTAVHNQITPLC